MGRAARTGFELTVDMAVFALSGDDLVVLMVKRGHDPHAGAWALPGGFVELDEDLADAARRELREETGVDVPGFLDQFGTYGAPDRDSRGRVVSVAHLAVLPAPALPTAGDDAAHAEWLPVQSLVHGRRRIAFDHRQVLRDALASLRGRLAATTIATAFCGREFTLSELRHVYEVVLGQPLDAGNFQRKMRTTEDFVVETGRTRPSPAGRGRPAALFRARSRRVTPLVNPMVQPDR